MQIAVSGRFGLHKMVQYVAMGHIYLHANAQLMGSDPDRLHDRSCFHHPGLNLAHIWPQSGPSRWVMVYICVVL